jgi:hypothetical protein
MPINPNIPLQAANIPQIRYQPESQFESFAKIQPTLNAMQQMRTQAMESQEKMAQRQALQKMRQDLMAAGKSGDLGMYAQALIGSGDARLMELGAKISQSLMEEQAAEQSLAPFRGQPVTRESVQNMMLAGGPAGRVAAGLERTLPAEPQPQSRYQVVGGSLFDKETKQFLAPPAPPAATGSQERRYISTGQGVFDTQTRQFVEGTQRPATVPAADGTQPQAAVAAARPLTALQQQRLDEQNNARQTLSEELATVLGYYEDLEAQKAMVSTGRTAGENVIAAARATGVGQAAERAMGTQAQTLRDNIANSKFRLIRHIAAITGASSRTMDSNRELQNWLDAMTNVSQSIQTVRETLGRLDEVIASVRRQQEREDAAVGRQAAPAPAPAPTPTARPGAAAPTPARTSGTRREIAPGVFVTERP